MKIIAIANQKGGVGKTTSAVNLSVSLSRNGQRVLCLDFDPQCHLSKYLGHTHDNLPTIADFIFAKSSYMSFPPADKLIRHSSFGVDYIPSSLALSKAEFVMAQAMFRERILRDVLEAVIPAESYDCCVIDCNPSMGILLTNVLAASDRVLIPVQTEEFSVDGLQDMLSLIQMVKANINPKLDIIGFLPTMVTRTKDAAEIIAWLNREFPSQTFTTSIGRYAEAPRSVKAQRPIVGTKSKLATQYEEAADELLERLYD